MASLEDAVRDMIEEVVDEKLADKDNRDADDIPGLEDMVKEIVRDEKPDLNTDDIENFNDVVRDECGFYLADNFQRFLSKALASDSDVQKVLENFIRHTVYCWVTDAFLVAKEKAE